MSNPAKKFLRIARLRERYDCSDEWIRRAMRDRAFPQPVTFGGRDRFWRVEELDAWDALMIQRGRQATPIPSSRDRR